MPSSIVQSFTDADAYAGFVPSTRVRLTIAKPGPLRAEATLIALDNLWMQRFSDNLPRVAHVAARPGRSIISFRTQEGPSLVWGGLELTPQTILWHGDALDSFQRSSGFAAWGSMSFPTDRLTELGGVMAGHALIGAGGSADLRPSAAAMMRLQRLHVSVASLATTAPGRFQNAAAVKGMEQALLAALVACLASPQPESRPIARDRRYALMRKFHALLEENPTQPVYMPELSAALGVSGRTLRDCCQEYLGIPPARYLMLRRMRLARLALQKETPDTTTITDTAMRFGFWELGRFAGEYKSYYGESPSVTLRRRGPASCTPFAWPAPEVGLNA
jgi:AraC-like DNA-binding protein